MWSVDEEAFLSEVDILHARLDFVLSSKHDS